MNRYIKKTSITENGEIVEEKILSFYSPFREGRGYNFKYKSLNVKSYLDIPLPGCFSDAEIGRIYKLSRLIYSDSNLLAKRSNNEVKPYTKLDLQAIVGLHRTKFNPFWSKVLENKIIKLVRLGDNEYYCFNPIYFNSTTYLPVYLYIAFQKELTEHLPKWVVNKYLDMQEGEEGNKKSV